MNGANPRHYPSTFVLLPHQGFLQSSVVLPIRAYLVIQCIVVVFSEYFDITFHVYWVSECLQAVLERDKRGASVIHLLTPRLPEPY